MPRFVILEHDHPHLHWDFMLEWGQALRTWRLAIQPDALGVEIPAWPLGEHRIAYLDYEGPVSGNRGEVKRWDAGTYDLAEDNENIVAVQLTGRRCRGMARLRRRNDDWVFRLDA